MRVLELFLIISLPIFASSFYCSKCQKYSIRRCSDDQCGGYDGQHLKCLFVIPQQKHADNNNNNKHKHEEALPSAISLPHDQQQHNWRKQVVSTISVSRRRILLGSIITAAASCTYYHGNDQYIAHASDTYPNTYPNTYTVDKVEPNEKDTYAEAQKRIDIDSSSTSPPLRILWLGSGTFTEQSGVFKNLFLSGTEVIAIDLLKPEPKALNAAVTYANDQGYQLRFEQGDATQLHFQDGIFDTVVCSMFLCQDFNPEVVVREIRRVLKTGGRFGFYEHVEDIDKVIVQKVFGEDSIIRIQHYPEMMNVMAGVVRKV